MANTFLAAQGHDVGKSLHEADQTDTVQDILKRASDAACQILLPTDAVVAEKFEAKASGL